VHSVRPLVLLLSLLICLGSPGAQAADIEGQRPVMFLGDVFQFVPGAWSSYYIHDRAKNEHYRMWISTLDKEKGTKLSASWMEIEVTMEKNPPVVTRFLVEETPQGPGELLDVIVQMKGYSPFTVPRKYYEGAEKEVGQFQTAHTLKRLAQKTIRYRDRDVKVVDVEAADPKGKKVSAIVSDNVLPVGVVMVENEEIGMYLDDWGGGGKSRIEGTPMNFYLWLMMQLGDGLTK
jgi:hypothetical protein